LSRDISFKLAGENEIKAQLRLPRGSWDGNAKGELKVTNEIMTFRIRNLTRGLLFIFSSTLNYSTLPDYISYIVYLYSLKTFNGSKWQIE